MSPDDVADKLAIQETISCYHQAASSFDWDRLVANFTSDAVWEVPAMGIRLEGHDVFRAQMPELVASIEYLVQINAPAVIDLNGDRAAARSLIRELARFHDGSQMDVVAHFDDELVRTPDGWRFTHRVFTIVGSDTTAAPT